MRKAVKIIAVVAFIVAAVSGSAAFLMFKNEVELLHSPECQSALATKSSQFMSDNPQNWQPYLDNGMRPLYINSQKMRLTWIDKDGKVKVTYDNPRLELLAQQQQFEELGSEVMEACYPPTTSRGQNFD